MNLPVHAECRRFPSGSRSPAVRRLDGRQEGYVCSQASAFMWPNRSLKEISERVSSTQQGRPASASSKPSLERKTPSSIAVDCGETELDPVYDLDIEPSKPLSRPGDRQCLGPNHLLCGNACTDVDLDRLIGGGRANMSFMDPPYNVAVSSWAAEIRCTASSLRRRENSRRENSGTSGFA